MTWVTALLPLAGPLATLLVFILGWGLNNFRRVVAFRVQSFGGYYDLNTICLDFFHSIVEISNSSVQSIADFHLHIQDRREVAFFQVIETKSISRAVVTYQENAQYIDICIGSLPPGEKMTIGISHHVKKIEASDIQSGTGSVKLLDVSHQRNWLKLLIYCQIAAVFIGSLVVWIVQFPRS